MSPESTLIAYCAACNHGLPVEDAGATCPGCFERTLRKRRVWNCACGGVFFFRRRDRDKHHCTGDCCAYCY